MYKNKHLLKLSQNFAKNELEKHLDFYRNHIPNMYNKENTEEAKEKYLNESIKHYYTKLTKIKNALLNGRFYAGVKSVSASGMSRIISIAYIYKNKLHTIRDEQITALACMDKKGRIGGCGMDMLFHAQYSLFNRLHTSHKKANYQKRMKNYNLLLP